MRAGKLWILKISRDSKKLRNNFGKSLSSAVEFELKYIFYEHI